MRWLIEFDDLPSWHLYEETLDQFIVARDARGIVAVGAIVYLPDSALLHSFAVSHESRNTGIGHAMLCAVETRARANKINDFYLPSPASRMFFRDHGYRDFPLSLISRRVASTAAFRDHIRPGHMPMLKRNGCSVQLNPLRRVT